MAKRAGMTQSAFIDRVLEVHAEVEEEALRRARKAEIEAIAHSFAKAA